MQKTRSRPCWSTVFLLFLTGCASTAAAVAAAAGAAALQGQAVVSVAGGAEHSVVATKDGQVCRCWRGFVLMKEGVTGRCFCCSQEQSLCKPMTHFCPVAAEVLVWMLA
jgi:hypothetical protein